MSSSRLLFLMDRPEGEDEKEDERKEEGEEVDHVQDQECEIGKTGYEPCFFFLEQTEEKEGETWWRGDMLE